jgi:hypothetical protein
MQILKRSLLLLGAAAFALTACKDDDPVEPEDTIAVTNITVSPSSMVLTVGDQAQLSASVATNGGTGTIDLGVNWTTSKATVASVTSAGLVDAKAAGTATITATSKANAAYSASSFVTVNNPPAAPNALLGFSVAPTVASVVLGGTVNLQVLPVTSGGATVTYANSSNNARCTVPATGAPGNTVVVTTTGTVGTCVITVTATATGAGLVTNSMAAAATINVTAQAPSLLGLTVTPTVVNLGPGGSQQVTTTTTIAQGAAAPTFVNSSNNAAIATVTPNGANPTITVPANAPNGTAIITIQATGGAGTGLFQNVLTATVEVNVVAASVSIAELRTCVGGPPCVVTPANLNAVAGQLEVELNIVSGNQKVDSVTVSFGVPVPATLAGSCDEGDGVAYTRAQGQFFNVNGAPEDPITLNINTAEFDLTTFVPKWLNVLQCVQAKIYPSAGTAQPAASNTFTFQLANPDVVFFNPTVGTTGSAPGLHHTGNSAAGPGGTWWRLGFTFRAHPVLYSGTANVASITYTSAGASNCGAVASGGAPNYVATFSCAGIETAATQNIANSVTINYVAGYAPFGAAPTTFVGVAPAGGFPAGTSVHVVNATREDNRGPVTHTPTFGFPGASIGGGLWAGNGSNAIALFQPTLFQLAAAAVTSPTTFNVTATDFGVGGATTPTITEITTGLTFNSGSTAAGIPLAETLTPVVYQNRGNASTDALGNVGLTNGTVSGCAGGTPVATTNRCALSGVYGVDLAVLDARYADGVYTSITGIAGVANPVRYQGANGSAATGAGIFTTLGVAVAPALTWGPINGATDLIIVDAIDTRSGLVQPPVIPAAGPLFQAVRRFSAAGSTNCYANVLGGDTLTVIQGNNYVQNAISATNSAAIDCTFGAGVPLPGYYTWTGFVADRANNRRKISRGAGAGTVVDSIWIAIDGALPNITGIGFQTGLYAGGSPADYSFSANDDLELKEGQVTLQYLGPGGPCGAPCATAVGAPGVPFLAPLGGVTFPYGSAAFTTAAFGTPFDGTITNVLNGSVLTLGYYIVRYDIATAAAFVPGPAPTGNVAGFTSSEIQSNVIANVRDVAYQSALAPLTAPILNTQIMDRPSAGGPPAGALAYTTMIDWRIVAKTGTPVVTVRDAAPTSFGVPFCDRVDIYEAVNGPGAATLAAAGMTANDPALGDEAGDGLRWRQTIAAAPVPTDNGFQRFWTYTSGSLALPVGLPAATGLFTAACVKSGSALLSPLF